MKIIFLDIDGVLNTSKIWWNGDRLDPVLVRRCRALVLKTKARVVLSSAWRYGDGFQLTREALRRNGWPECTFLGRTPYDGSYNYHRGMEITNYLKEHTFRNMRYVVLDDDPNAGYGHHGRFVQTCYDRGLSAADVQAAESILDGSLLRRTKLSA